MRPRELTNFTVWGRGWFADGWPGLERFCRAHGLAGVELLASGTDTEPLPPEALIQGVHLSSLGSWLPLVGLGVQDYATGAARYAAADSYSRLVRMRADELRTVARLAPRYAVWHAAYALRDRSFECEALTADVFLPLLAALVQDVCDEFQPPFCICFENAHGVSLEPGEPSDAAFFLRSLSGLDVALALDIGHHLNNHRELATPGAAVRELRRVACGLRDVGARTDVLHLHWTPPETVAPAPDGVVEEPGDYFARSDRHHPLCHRLLPEAVGVLRPEFVVHEMGAMSLAQHDEWLAAQTAALRGQVADG